MHSQCSSHIVSVSKADFASFSTGLNEMNRYFFWLFSSSLLILGRKTGSEMCFYRVIAPSSCLPNFQVPYGNIQHDHFQKSLRASSENVQKTNHLYRTASNSIKNVQCSSRYRRVLANLSSFFYFSTTSNHGVYTCIECTTAGIMLVYFDPFGEHFLQNNCKLHQASTFRPLD